jgi:hypothetical protein
MEKQLEADCKEAAADEEREREATEWGESHPRAARYSTPSAALAAIRQRSLMMRLSSKSFGV